MLDGKIWTGGAPIEGCQSPGNVHLLGSLTPLFALQSAAATDSGTLMNGSVRATLENGCLFIDGILCAAEGSSLRSGQSRCASGVGVLPLRSSFAACVHCGIIFGV
ncbi:hypothetical protein TcYC6_0033830 [Trypanosoma cruzi]|nr:hypothetical protein TcYC6_0033830 [Trypanosoma cruzi]